MSYLEAIKYLEPFVNYEKTPAYPYQESLKLERINNFLKAINNPQEALRSIHVAGTKGKGSTCAFIAYILRAAGFRVGLYTSPHLSDFRERIRILGCKVIRPQVTSREFEGMISKTDLARLVEKLKPAITKYNKNSAYGPLTLFEAYTALAFVYFKEKKVDLAVLETGLGGRLDATNTVNPLACAITPISYEHTQILGRSLKKIAAEKAGIIKVHSPAVVCAPQEKEAREVIISRCKKVKAKLYEVGKDITYKIQDGIEIKGVFNRYKGIRLRLIGEHQIINAATAIGAVEALRFYGIKVSVDSIRRGIYNTLWPGRCEVIARNPLVVLDGAQNIASAQALKETIKSNFKYKKLILVLGISNDKDLKGICSELRGIADEIILTKAQSSRATPPQVLAQYFKNKAAYLTQGVKEAKVLARAIAKKEDLILVTGSLFVVGEFRGCP